MTFEEKWQAIERLCPGAAIRATYNPKSGEIRWYIDGVHIEICGDGMRSSINGSAATPEAAVCNWWLNAVTNLHPNLYLEGSTGGPKFRWLGSDWGTPIERSKG